MSAAAAAAATDATESTTATASLAPSSIAPPAPAQGLTVAITGARLVATWRWNVADDDDVCGICRLAFEHCCPGCKLPGDDCPPILGACKHAFHLHCITTWLGTKDKEQVCPLCRRVWEMS